jgi:hypothetical protein
MDSTLEGGREGGRGGGREEEVLEISFLVNFLMTKHIVAITHTLYGTHP